MSHKIKSVLELSKYKQGETLYWVTLRPVADACIKIPEGDEWMKNVHPKVVYDRGLAKKTWRYRTRLPKLCSLDFQCVVDLLTSEPIVEKFVINSIYRSCDTGEFYYLNEHNEWMPEESLFTTAVAAKKEKARLKALFKRWSEQMSPDEC